MNRSVRFLPLLVGLAGCTILEPGTAPVARVARPAATVGPKEGAANDGFVNIVEYVVPTPKAFPHDPAVAPDGALWFTEQKANKIGKLDPKSGRFREYPLKTPDSGPHGLTIDPTGIVWFTASERPYIGALDPETGIVTEHLIGDARVKDTHTPVLGADGSLWFTAERSNVVGKLDTKTGQLAISAVPTENAKPYGIVIGRDGAPYFCEFGTNKIGRIDPNTMSIREFTLPDDARPRRIALAPDGSLYFSDFARGRIGRFVPNTNEVHMIASPGGPDSHPYAIAATGDGAIWYVETGSRPNMLVRMRPDTQTFRSAMIPSDGGVVRNMVATPTGELYLAESGVNRVAVAKTNVFVAAR
jgi:virginiamycin B lyase